MAEPTASGGQPRQDPVKSVQRKVDALADRTARSTQSFLQSSKDKVGDQFDALANVLQRVADDIRNDDQFGIARRLESAGNRVERAADYVRRSDPAALRRDVNHLVRTRPWLIVGGAFALGFVGARFLKSSTGPDTKDEDRPHRRDRREPSDVDRRGMEDA